MRIFVALLVACLQIAHGNGQNGNTLRYVQAIWRHGDRAPLEKPYPSDKYGEIRVIFNIKCFTAQMNPIGREDGDN